MVEMTGSNAPGPEVAACPSPAHSPRPRAAWPSRLSHRVGRRTPTSQSLSARAHPAASPMVQDAPRRWWRGSKQRPVRLLNVTGDPRGAGGRAPPSACAATDSGPTPSPQVQWLPGGVSPRPGAAQRDYPPAAWFINTTLLNRSPEMLV